MRQDAQTVRGVEKNRTKNSNKWFAIAFVIIYNMYKSNIRRKECDLYELDDVYGFNEEEVNKYLDIIKSTAHLIIEFAKGKGFENASSF